ncbi:hypothetical protein ABPG72_013481 [Tetrahymena utriculariae]
MIKTHSLKEYQIYEFTTNSRYQDKFCLLVDDLVEQQNLKVLDSTQTNFHPLQLKKYLNEHKKKNMCNYVSKNALFVYSAKNQIKLFHISQCSKQNLINIISKNEQKKLIKFFESKKENYFECLEQQRIIGGGQCCSRQDITLGLQNIQYQNNTNNLEQKDIQIDAQFRKFFEKNVANQIHISEVVEKRDYANEIINIFDKCLNKKKEQITLQTSQYKIYIIEMFNLCLQYLFSGALNIDRDDQNQIIRKIDIFLRHIKQSLNLFPCQDLEFLYQFLYDLSDLEFEQSSQGYKNIPIIAEFYKLSLLSIGQNHHPLFVNEKLELNKEGGKSYQNFLMEVDKQDKLDNVWQIVDKGHEKIRSFTKYSIAKHISLFLALKTQRFYKQNEIKATDELIFLIEQIIEYTNIQASGGDQNMG